MGMSQLFSTATGTAAAPGGSSSASPTSSPKKRTLYVQVFGQKGLAKLVTEAADVADLTKEVMKELKLDVSPSAMSLYLAELDKDTDEVKSTSEKPLPPRKSLVKAKVGDKACIVVKVAAVRAANTGACAALHYCVSTC